ncbi:MAG: methyltransferase C-terminal domain-containing protein [Thermodesulfovibrionales bacterium]
MEELPTHGGSLRIYARTRGGLPRRPWESGWGSCGKGTGAGFDRMERYRSFGEKVRAAKRSILDFMVRASGRKSIAGYGAPAREHRPELLHGIRTDFIDYTVDRSPYKQNRYLPGSRIPICAPERGAGDEARLLLILPWNLKEEVMEQMACIREWGAGSSRSSPR